MDIEEGGNIDDNVEFNNLSDLDVFTRQYIGTSLQGRDDAISVIDEEESNSTNASTELFDSQSEKDSITDLESLRNDQASDEDRFNSYDRHLIIYRNQYMQYQENLYDQTYGIKCLKAFSFENMVNIILSEYQHKFKPKLLDNIPIYLYWIDNQLSRCGQQSYLDILHNNIRSLRGKTDSIPRSVGGVKYLINRTIKHDTA